MKHGFFRVTVVRVFIGMISIQCVPMVSQAKTVVYGSKHIAAISSHASKPFYLQTGAFGKQAIALGEKEKYVHQGYPIRIEQHGVMYAVIVGPIPTYSELQRFATTPRYHSVKQVHTHQHHARMTTPQKAAHNSNWMAAGSKQKDTQRTVYSKKDPSYVIPPDQTKSWFLLDEDHWYFRAEGGGASPSFASSMTVDNGSNYPSPYNVDVYTTSKQNQGILALSAGKRWKAYLPFLDRVSLGLRYQHFFKRNMGGTITQYSMPQFLNYTYSWDISANTFTADTKLNLIERYHFSPYINGGLGLSLNQTQAFNEVAIPPVTPRYSPAFQNMTKGQFTYHVGAGLDYQLKEQWLISLGYEFQQLGTMSSAAGLSTWSGEKLSLGQYKANVALIGLTYLTN